MYRAFFTASLLFMLFGCEMAGEARNMSTGGAEAFSCEQIRAAFRAYEADRDSFDALIELSSMTDYELTQTATKSADDYYEKARQNANLALIIKGCPPLE